MKTRAAIYSLAIALPAAWAFHRAHFAARASGAERKTVADRVAQFSDPVRERLATAFQRADAEYPPRHLVLVGLKAEKLLQIYVPARSGALVRVVQYPVLAASGTTGPKLCEGDLQVPEGLYRIESLNPNSLFHLSLRINYPNDEDRAIAAREGRDHLGGDIMIHGGAASVGCLAIGDPAIEELFILAALAGPPLIRVILAPYDFRITPPPEHTSPPWLAARYRAVASALAALPLPSP